MRFKKDNTKLICDVGELAELFTASTTLESFLQRIVEMVAEHMGCDVCSIYLYYNDTQELVLSANHGFNKGFIGKIKLKLGEGLTGLALKELRPICERNASKNESFRYFPGLGEEQYESFLAVPIMRGTTRIGAMVIQNTKKDYFADEDIKCLRAITSQLATTLEMARLIMSLEAKRDFEKDTSQVVCPSFIKGKVGSEGWGMAPAIIISAELSLRNYLQLKPHQTIDLEDFKQAIVKTEKQLEDFQTHIEERLADVASLIFSAQILMLKDQAFIDAITREIQNGTSVITSVVFVVESYVKKFEGLQSEYLRQKAQDIRDIGRRLLDNLLEKDERFMDVGGKIVIADDLFPSDVLKLSSEEVKGIILLSGGATSHVAILSQSLNIPLVIANEPSLLQVPVGSLVLLDAEQGNVYVNPSAQVLDSVKDRQFAQSQNLAASDETWTKDKERVYLLANINLLGDLKNARNFKAEGIGLYRTEFPFIIRSDFPSEEEQYVIYKKLVEGMSDKEITFRTLDIGGDKVLSYFQHHAKENNPFLGMRSIRFSLEHKDVFSHQIRAILRASIGANARIMFPMISSLDEFIAAKNIYHECQAQLKEEGQDFNDSMKLGIMIELPSVLEIIEELAHTVDFFSIGTNDFVQYMLAVDRTNEKVANLYLPHHPSVLRALKKVVDAAHKYKKDVSICGDMAHEEKYLEYFLGIGLRKFSLNPSYLPRIQKAVALKSVSESCEKTRKLLQINRVSEISNAMDL